MFRYQATSEVEPLNIILTSLFLTSDPPRETVGKMKSLDSAEKNEEWNATTSPALTTFPATGNPRKPAESLQAAVVVAAAAGAEVVPENREWNRGRANQNDSSCKEVERNEKINCLDKSCSAFLKSKKINEYFFLSSFRIFVRKKYAGIWISE